MTKSLRNEKLNKNKVNNRGRYWYGADKDMTLASDKPTHEELTTQIAAFGVDRIEKIPAGIISARDKRAKTIASIKIAQKQHICKRCAKSIPKGTEYWRTDYFTTLGSKRSTTEEHIDCHTVKTSK